MAQAVARGVVDGLLVRRHGRHVLVEGHVLLLSGGIEHQEVLQKVRVHAVLVVDAELDALGEGLVEGLVFLPVAVQHLLELGLDLLLQVVGDGLQLPVVLQPRDVQGQIRGVHQALDEAEVVGEQILAGVHDHDAAAIQLQPPLVALGEEVPGGLLGDEQQRRVGHCALHRHPDHAQGVVHVEEVVPVEPVVLLVRDLALCPLPQGDHGVEDHVLGDVLVLLGLALLLLALGHPLLLHHADGIADVVAVLLDQRGESVLPKVLAVVLALLVVL